MSPKTQPTIYDISQAAGVSIATVSRVINQNPNVTEATRERVTKVMKDFGYTPNVFARGLGLNSMKTIGILCADSSDIYLAKAVYLIEQGLRENGYNSLLCCTGYEVASKAESCSLLISKKVDAVILVGSNFVSADENANEYIRNAAKMVPVMILNAPFDCKNVYSVFCDDFRAVSDVVEKLLKQGRKNLLYMYDSDSYSGRRKRLGFEDGFKKSGLEPDKENEYIIKTTGGAIISGMEFLAERLKKNPKIDGIIASEDVLAVASMKYIKRAGLKVPEDIAVVGYNNSMLSELAEPTLTSVDNKLEGLCANLVSVLLGVLDGRDMPERTQFSGETVWRETT